MIYDSRLDILDNCFGTLYNLSKFHQFYKKFKDLGVVLKVLPYLKCQVQYFALEALMILSYLIEESNNHLIMSDEGILDICHLMQLIPVEEIYFYLTTLSIESTNFMSLFPFISTFTST